MSLPASLIQTCARVAPRSFTNERLADGTDEWLTPLYIVRSLGEFDLDPCAALVQPWLTARRHFTVLENGLSKQWHGRVWMNPPYGNQTKQWMSRLSSHGDGVAMIYARTETNIFFPFVWDLADAVFFLRGRVRFIRDGDRSVKREVATAPSCLVAYGRRNVEALRMAPLNGKLVVL